jgi:hypothetical protein
MHILDVDDDDKNYLENKMYSIGCRPVSRSILNGYDGGTERPDVLLVDTVLCSFLYMENLALFRGNVNTSGFLDFGPNFVGSDLAGAKGPNLGPARGLTDADGLRC